MHACMQTSLVCDSSRFILSMLVDSLYLLCILVCLNCEFAVFILTWPIVLGEEDECCPAVCIFVSLCSVCSCSLNVLSVYSQCAFNVILKFALSVLSMCSVCSQYDLNVLSVSMLSVCKCVALCLQSALDVVSLRSHAQCALSVLSMWLKCALSVLSLSQCALNVLSM